MTQCRQVHPTSLLPGFSGPRVLQWGHQQSSQPGLELPSPTPPLAPALPGLPWDRPGAGGGHPPTQQGPSFMGWGLPHSHGVLQRDPMGRVP